MNILRSLLARYFRICYAQYAEDILMAEVLAPKRKIIYVDIGANHPIFGSNTFAFHIRGGHGICIEPNADFQALHRRFRPRDIFLSCAVSDCDAPELFFNNPGASTDAYVSKDGSQAEAQQVRVKNLHINSVLAMLESSSIDVLSLDTETMDAQIIEAIDFARFRISVICVETNKSPEEKDRLSGILSKNGYSVFVTNPVNTIFTHASLRN